MQTIMPIIDNVFLPLCLWLVMFSMGLSLVPADFARVFATGRPYMLAMISMLVLVPLAGVLIATQFAPTQALMMGFILLATCPGGLLSNLLTSLSRGDLALSVSLSLSTSIVYIFSLPVTTHFALQYVFGTQAAIPVPLAASFWEILRITVFPIACGMLIRSWREDFAFRYLPMIKQGSTLCLCVIFGLIVVDNLDTLRRSYGVVLAMVIGMNLTNLLIALLIGRLGRMNRPQRIAVTIEHLIRQETTAIYVAVAILGRTDMSLPMIINTFVGMFVCLFFIAVLKRRRARDASLMQTLS